MCKLEPIELWVYKDPKVSVLQANAQLAQKR